MLLKIEIALKKTQGCQKHLKFRTPELGTNLFMESQHSKLINRDIENANEHADRFTAVQEKKCAQYDLS